MKRVFVCSPLRATEFRTMEEHIDIAKDLCHETVKMGHAAFAPHVLYTLFLDDTIKEERENGIQAGVKFLEVCDEIWVATKCGGISKGMQHEIDFCKENKIDIKFDPWSKK